MISVAAATILLLSTLAQASSICSDIASAVSSAASVNYDVPLEGIIDYQIDTSHWAASSTGSAACTVRPANAADLGIVLQYIATTRTPFAVKGGGHTTNPGFSSTTDDGVHISLINFSEVTYHPDTQTVDIGSGLIWDDVYAALEPYGVIVVGGRVTGVGVAGFSLGGGYSWLSNQYGLTVDNIVSYELVLPSGQVQTVDSSVPDLFFALKGGYNNFGIVTKFTMKAYPQGQVWGGLITITGDYLDAVTAATAKFSAQVNDPKAAIITTYNHLLGSTGVSQLLFYDGPNPPAGIFDDFLAIPNFTKDVSTRSFLDLVLASPSNLTGHVTRGYFNTVSVTSYTPALLAAVVNETNYWGSQLFDNGGVFISYDVEPFLASSISHGTEASSAYPPSRSTNLLPLNLYYAWLLSSDDSVFHDAIVQSAEQLTKIAVLEGQDIASASLYGNYAIYSTPSDRIFGSKLAQLKSAKQKYDPTNIMGLAGGWKL